MKKPVLMLASIIFAVCAVPGVTLGEQPAAINYQGKLVQGKNLVSGTVTMVFRVYTNAVGGAFVYEETNQVTVVDGYYSVLLGKHANYGQMKKVAKMANAFIEITVNGNTLSPRERFTPPPFAEQAEEVWREFSFAGGNERQMEAVYAEWLSLFSSLGCSAGFTEMNNGGLIGTLTNGLAVFPPPLEDKQVVEARVYIGYETCYYVPPLGNRPTLNLEVTGFYGPPKRVISENLDVKSMPTNQWVSFTLTGSEADRTISPNELLVVRYNSRTNSLPEGAGSYGIYNIMFQIRLK